MKVEITDPHLGTRTIGDKPSDLIRDQLKLLELYRDDGRVPSQHLLDDIRVYEYILGSEDPDVAADQYMKERMRLEDERKTFGIDKSEVAKNLGWNIGNN